MAALIAWSTCGIAACTAQAPSGAERTPADEQHRVALQALAEQVTAAGHPELAQAIRAWHVPHPPDRQHFFGPPRSSQDLLPPQGQATAWQPWTEAFARRRELQAERLWQLIPLDTQRPSPAGVLPLLYEIVRERPDDPRARRILGLPTDVRPDLPRPLSWPVAAARRAQRELGWAAGTYWRVSTDHFLIETNTSPDVALQVAQILEDLHCVWRQLFAGFWCRPEDLQRALVGRRLPPPYRARHRVIHFQDRAQYIDYLLRFEPQIEVSLGVYRESDRVSYLYGSADDLAATWRHEVTHQLFHESVPARDTLAAEENFWVREGVALYMESVRDCGAYFTVGGFDAERLQYARYRLLNERFFVPLGQFAGLGRLAWQRDPRLRRLYSQAAGLTHFLMDFQQGRYREAFLDWITRQHTGDNASESVAERLQVAVDDLEQQYRQWMVVGDSQLEAQFAPPAQVPRCAEPTKLCFGHTQVTDKGLRCLSQLTQLEWLDLAYCGVTDDALMQLSLHLPLRQLNLEGTLITDRGVAHLAHWSQLQELDLSETQVSDRSLPDVARLQELRVLWLTGTRVTDEGLAALLRLPHLERLDLSRTAVSPEGWQQFLRQTPAPLSQQAEHAAPPAR